MEGQFPIDRGTCASAHDGYEPIGARAANGHQKPWQFVGDFARMVGDDSEPDPQFFVETWTLGMTAAVENFQKRRQRKRVFGEMDNFEPAPFRRQSDFGFRIGALGAPERVDEGSVAEAARRQEWESFAGDQETAQPMTRERACAVLGVTEASTRSTIKAAFRRRVSQWHPDRLGNTTDEQRKEATERMATINEAYRLLRNAGL